MYQCSICSLLFYSKMDVTRHLYYEKEKEALKLTQSMRLLPYRRYRRIDGIAHFKR